jgi:hypothetical protein
MTTFINTLPYISNPVEEFKDFEFVSWERNIYPKFKGLLKKQEIDFFVNLIAKRGLASILDLGVGGGFELTGIIKTLKKQKYKLKTVEANELNEDFIMQASTLFYKKNLHVLIHKGNWIGLPDATPQYENTFDFTFLTGNSLSYLGGGSREYTKDGVKSILGKFSQLIQKGGYLFIDTRNFDYIRSLINLPIKEVVKNFNFDYTVYYHGSQKDIVVFPAYISDTIVVLHYYDIKQKIWSKLDYFPLYQHDMIEILSHDFEIEKIYHDFSEENKRKSIFIQYLARKK